MSCGKFSNHRKMHDIAHIEVRSRVIKMSSFKAEIHDKENAHSHFYHFNCCLAPGHFFSLLFWTMIPSRLGAYHTPMEIKNALWFSYPQSGRHARLKKKNPLPPFRIICIWVYDKIPANTAAAAAHGVRDINVDFSWNCDKNSSILLIFLDGWYLRIAWIPLDIKSHPQTTFVCLNIRSAPFPTRAVYGEHLPTFLLYLCGTPWIYLWMCVWNSLKKRMYFRWQGVAKGGPGPSNFPTNEIKCVFKKRKFKVCISCSWRCSGTSTPSAPHLTVSLYLWSSRSNTRGESRTLEGHRVSSKSPSRVRDGDGGVAGRNGRDKCFPDKGVIDLPSRQIHDFFYKRETEKSCVSCQTLTGLKASKSSPPSTSMGLDLPPAYWTKESKNTKICDTCQVLDKTCFEENPSQ